MSAQDRLATIIAEHRVGYDFVDETLCCDCGDRWTLGSTEALRAAEDAHIRHQAAVIASSDDLAVVALEAPRRRRDSYSRPIKGWLPWKRGVVHIAPEGMVPREGRYEGAYSVRYDDQRGGGTVYTPKSAREFAAALLAAAKAAEAVTRDGE